MYPENKSYISIKCIKKQLPSKLTLINRQLTQNPVRKFHMDKNDASSFNFSQKMLH